MQLIPEPAGFLGDAHYIGFAAYEYDAQMSQESVIFERMDALLSLQNGEARYIA